MFHLPSGPELIFIFGLALIVFGPKKLPEIGKTIGQGLRELRKASRELTDTFDLSDITSNIPTVNDLLSDDRPERYHERHDELDDSTDRLLEPEPVTDLDSQKENNDDVTDSLGRGPAGLDHNRTDSGSVVRSEETAGDRQVDGGGDSRVQEGSPQGS